MLETVSTSEVFTKELKAFWAAAYPEIKTERGLLNLAYMSRATEVIENTPGCSWLLDCERARAGEKDAWKRTILIELGKIKDIEAMIAVALLICELKPKQKTGALIVKQFRLGKHAGDSVDLANELIGVINSYLFRYKLEHDDVIEALQIAYDQIVSTAEPTEKLT